MHRRLMLALVATLAAFATAAASSTASTAPAPKLRLIAATPSVDLFKYRGQPLTLDIHAYVASVGGEFRIDASKARYGAPIVAKQVVGGTRRTLPSWVANDWTGLRGFLHYDVRNAKGTLVTSLDTAFCPFGYNMQRIDDTGPASPTFPFFCGTNPFTLGSVWGIDRGWASGLDFSTPPVNLPLGWYTVTVSIPQRYVQLFHIDPKDASVAVRVHVVSGSGGCAPPCGGVGRPAQRQAAPESVATVTKPDPSTVPDLIPLPSWGINTSHIGSNDYLEFGATIWDRGPAPMVVEGFRRPGKNIMDAFQYFYKNGVAVGRAPAGTMEYDARPGHQHWHFKQFAEYSLLDSTKKLVVVSQKEAFCLAPTDAIDLLVPNALWSGFQIGLPGACGDVSSLWTRETLPVGWGDTYFQGLPGQSFDITKLRNGRYYIKVRANPSGVLIEASKGNNTTYRLVILGGTPGHRTVTVPAYHGIDSH
jgi:hypothetical protein